MNVRKIKETELMEANNISSLCFGWVHNTEGITMENYIKRVQEHPVSKGDAYFLDIWAAFTDEGEMMSCINVIPYEVAFDKSQLKMSGIGGVCTYPQHRRKGAVRECLCHALKEMYDNGICFSYLYPFSEQFYGNFGYIRSSASILWSFDLTAIPDYRYDGSFHLYRGDGNYNDYDAVYQNYAKNFNMMVKRDSFDWDLLKLANPFKEKRSAYLYKDSTGKPCGYLVFEKSRDNHQDILDCKEVIFDSFQTLKAIMSFAKTYSADYSKIQFSAPSCLSLDYFCKDYSQSSSYKHIKQNGMVRVVNVKEVLKHALYKGSGNLDLLIHDSYLEKNNKIFHVIYKAGAAVKITTSKISDLVCDPKATDSPVITTPVKSKKVDIEMTINQFSAAIVGNYEVADFEYQEGITLNCKKEKASDLFYRKPCWINNYF